MKYEILTCEVVKIDVTDVISTSEVYGDKVSGETPAVPVY